MKLTDAPPSTAIDQHGREPYELGLATYRSSRIHQCRMAQRLPAPSDAITTA